MAIHKHHEAQIQLSIYRLNSKFEKKCYRNSLRKSDSITNGSLYIASQHSWHNIFYISEKNIDERILLEF